MRFDNLRIKDIKTVIKYRPRIKKWSAKKRKDHIVGIHLCGEAIHDFGYQEFVLSGNCIFFLNQKDDYEVEVIKESEAYSIHFTTDEEIETDSFCVPISNEGEMISLLNKAELALRSGDELKLMSHAYRFCSELVRAHERTYSPKDERIVSAKRYIDEGFRDRDCLSSAVALSGLSSRRFNDLFKGIFGITPQRYIIERKVEEARALLDASSMSVTEIAEQCGFSDLYYFSKVFKDRLGVSPRRYRIGN